ncbi:MAG TPA: class I adenylate-forming enzyme family protein [Myxococcota bacterium]|nr:class I adenylate-forming enzyme family protein [Myxococcota bacterium]
MMLLEMTALGFPDRVVLTHGSDHFTAAELFAAAGAAAAEIRASGAEKTAFLDVSSPALPVAMFGAAWAGTPFVPLNYRLTGAEVDRLIDQITPCYLVTDAPRAAELGGREGVQAISSAEFLARVRGAATPDPTWNMDPDEIAVLLFTSGTTGPPKAAVLRHKHIVSYILGTAEFGSAPDGAAALSCVPPYHIAGVSAIASSLYSGRRIVQLSNFDADAWIDLVRNEGVTNAFVVPTMLARIVEALEKRGGGGLPSLRAISYGGGKMPLPVIERAMRVFPPHTDFTNAYGLTETSSTLTLLGPEDHRTAAASEVPEVRQRLASVGRALPGVELEIRDGDGKKVWPGERGEICVRGEQVSGEYLGKGTRVGSDGFFPTRDAGWIDEEGYLFLEGRADDIIVRGGENMSPGEIEDVLIEHPAVADCAVVGVPDEQWGEAVAAAIVVKPGASVGAEELQEFVKKRLRSSRSPQHVVFRNELPYNETGKLLRRVVREDLAGEVG